MSSRTARGSLSERWERLAGRSKERLLVLAVVVGTVGAAGVVVVAALLFNDPAEGRKVVAAILIGLGGLGLAIWVLYGMLPPAEARPVKLRPSKPGRVLAGVDLRGAVLPGAELQESELTGARLTGADLRSADLREAGLRGADLRGADLRWADLDSADLSGSDLRDADLRHSNLEGAIGDDVRLEGALFNRDTNCAGRDFEELGAVFVEERQGPKP